ncbi:MAG: hypothetical protein ACJAZO_001742 [Myxococcota bacterium]
MDSECVAALRCLRRCRILVLLTAALWASEPNELPGERDGNAAATLHVEAWVSDDLRNIRGTFSVSPDLAEHVVHPLPRLPGVADDLTLLRTYPGREDLGKSTLVEVAPGDFTFTTRLPRRFGDVGATRHGLFANGWWTPLLTVGAQRDAIWDVTLHLPNEATGVIADVVGEGTLTWIGAADRVSIAVFDGGIVTRLSDDVQVVSRRPPNRRVTRELTAVVDAAPSTRGVLVMAPLRRRLTRPGQHMSYISDRAFRVTSPLPRFHRTGVARGVYAGLSGLDNDFSRSLAGSALARKHSDELRAMNARRALGLFSWLPSIDFILFDRTLPFYGDVLQTSFPSDPLSDDLSEVFTPHMPGAAAIDQLVDLQGEDFLAVFTDQILAGTAPEVAAGLSSAPPSLLVGWSHAYAEQDYTLDIDQDAIVVTREAPEDAPSEVIVVQRGKERIARQFPSGPGTWVLPRDGARSVRLDPRRHTEQLRRLGDAWPQRFRVTVSGGIGSINLSEGWVSGGAGAFLRRSGDNRNTAALSVGTSRDTVVVAGLGYTHRFGPQLSGLSRRHAVSISTSTALQNQRFADEDDPPITLAGRLGWGWSNRQGGLFPLRGWRTSASLSAGVAPTTTQRWLSVSTSAVRLIPLHPRLVWASRGTVGLAQSDIRGRLLSLGGAGAVGGIGFGGAFGTSRAAITTELRVVPLRNLSVPLWLLWGTELQLSAGVEAGTIGTPDGGEHAVGATFGIAGVGDIFGADPYMLGFTLGVPLWWTAGVEKERPFQLVLRWTQDF